MEEIKISDLPEYAKNSKMYEGMEQDEIVFVPKNYLIYNEKIKTFVEYKKLIESYNYFLADLSDEIIKFQKDPENKYDVLEFLIKNRDSAFFKKELDSFEEPSLRIEESIDIDLYKKKRKIGFILKYFFQQSNSETFFDKILINYNECKMVLNKIEQSENFEIIVDKYNLEINDDKSFYVNIKNNKVVFYSSVGIDNFFLESKFTFDKDRIIKIYKKLFEKIEKYEKFIKSKKIFAILDHEIKIVLLTKKKDLIIENIDSFFSKYYKYIVKYFDDINISDISKENIIKYLKKQNRII